jgi:hypothetical protein
MLITVLVFPTFVAGFFFMIILSFLAIAAGITLLFIVSSILLVSGDVFTIVLGIGLVVFCLLILVTGSILAFAVMSQKRAAINATKKLLSTNNNGRQINLIDNF